MSPSRSSFNKEPQGETQLAARASAVVPSRTRHLSCSLCCSCSIRRRTVVAGPTRGGGVRRAVRRAKLGERCSTRPVAHQLVRARADSVRFGRSNRPGPSAKRKPHRNLRCGFLRFLPLRFTRCQASRAWSPSRWLQPHEAAPASCCTAGEREAETQQDEGPGKTFRGPRLVAATPCASSWPAAHRGFRRDHRHTRRRHSVRAGDRRRRP